jgi:hypothetical protein
MNAKRNVMGTLTALMHPNVAAEEALQSRNIIITADTRVDTPIVDVEENES